MTMKLLPHAIGQTVFWELKYAFSLNPEVFLYYLKVEVFCGFLGELKLDSVNKV